MNDIHLIWVLNKKIESKENQEKLNLYSDSVQRQSLKSLRSWNSEAVCTDFRSQNLTVEEKTTEACTLLQKLQSEVQRCQHQQRTRVRSSYNHYPNTPCALYGRYSCYSLGKKCFLLQQGKDSNVNL